MILEKYYYIFGTIKANSLNINEKVRLNQIDSFLFTIPYKEIAMVVTKVSDEVLPTRDNMIGHEKIISKLLSSYTVIPFSFGNIFRSKKDILLLLETLYDQFQALFPILDNKIEVGLKLLGKKEWIDRNLEKHTQLLELDDKIKTKSEAESLFERIKLGDLAKSFYSSLQQELQEQIIKPLGDIADATKINDSLSERMIINAAFLIDRDKEKVFDDRVNELYQQWHRDLEFKYTGPWAPYNFITIKLKIEGEQ